MATPGGSLGNFFEQLSVAESQASRSEGAVRTFEELLPVHNFALESQTGEKISVQYNAVPWLLEFVTLVVNNIWLARMFVLFFNA